MTWPQSWAYGCRSSRGLSSDGGSRWILGVDAASACGEWTFLKSCDESQCLCWWPKQDFSMILILQLLSILHEFFCFRRPLFELTRCKSLNPKAIADGKPGTLFHRLPSVPNADGGNCTGTNIDEVDFVLSLRVAVQQ